MKTKITFILISFLFAGMINAQSKTTGFLFDLTVPSVKLNSSGYNIGLLSIIPYYKPTENLSIGIGTGFMVVYDSDTDDDFIALPVYGYGRWDFLNGKRVTPFLSAKAGYGIISENEKYTYVTFDENMEMTGVEKVDISYKGGVFGSFSVGFLYHLRKNRALSFSLTPKYQKIRGRDNTGKEPNFKTNFDNSALSLDIGMVF